MARQRDDKGRFVEVVPLNEVADFVRQADQFVSTRDVADAFDIPWRTANHKLHKLVEEDTVEKRKLGQTSLWIPVLSTPSPPTEGRDGPGAFHRFRGVMNSEKSAVELVAEAREKDAEREDRLSRAAGNNGKGER